MKAKLVRLITGSCILFSLSMQISSAMTVAALPEGAWAYSTLSTVAGDLNYFPTQESEFSSASFVSYMTYDSIFNGWFMQRSFSAPSGFHVFTTWVTSSQDQTISFINGGNDGHSLFIDGTFLGGAGFGVDSTGNFSLATGVPRRLTLVTHNSGGDWHANLFTNPSQDRVIENTPGLSISAIPEPSTFMMIWLLSPLFTSRRLALRIQKFH